MTKSTSPAFRIAATFAEGTANFTLKARTPLAAVTKAMKSLGYDFADPHHSPLLLTVVPTAPGVRESPLILSVTAEP